MDDEDGDDFGSAAPAAAPAAARPPPGPPAAEVARTLHGADAQDDDEPPTEPAKPEKKMPAGAVNMFGGANMFPALKVEIFHYQIIYVDLYVSVCM